MGNASVVVGQSSPENAKFCFRELDGAVCHSTSISTNIMELHHQYLEACVVMTWREKTWGKIQQHNLDIKDFMYY